jgi:hypothetical protein
LTSRAGRDGARRGFPWYDSGWLARYVRAKEFIARRHPARLTDFVEALRPLHTRPDFREKLLDDFFTPQQADTVRAAFEGLKPEMLDTSEIGLHGRFVVEDHPGLAGLHAEVTPRASELAGEALEPAYTFIALYNRNGKCAVHLDAPHSKWTLDYCIEQSEPWPVCFSDVVAWPETYTQNGADWETDIKRSGGHAFNSYSLAPGQAVFFSGSSQWHYREPFANPNPQSHCSLLFLHFAVAGARDLTEWKGWESRFDIPGLTAALE